MEVIKKVINKESIRLIPLGDMHIGHVNCDLKEIERTIDYISYYDDALWIGMGDYCDAITAKDRRFNPKEVSMDFPTPDIQYRTVQEMFEPIKDKCIGLLHGNHDYTHWTEHNHNYVDQMAYNLKVPYLTVDAYVRLAFERANKNVHIYNIYAHHGSSGSKTDTGKVKSIQDLSLIFPMLDLYLMGHVHKRSEAPTRVQLDVDNKLNIIQHEERFVLTGGYIKGYVEGRNTYIETAALPPTSIGSPVIVIKNYYDDVKRPQNTFDVHIENILDFE